MDSAIWKNGKVIWAEANFVLSFLQTVVGTVCAGQVTGFILKLNKCDKGIKKAGYSNLVLFLISLV
jgi:hypothetical protein